MYEIHDTNPCGYEPLLSPHYCEDEEETLCPHCEGTEDECDCTEVSIAQEALADAKRESAFLHGYTCGLERALYDLKNDPANFEATLVAFIAEYKTKRSNTHAKISKTFNELKEAERDAS